MTQRPALDLELRARVEDFLIEEARLLDEGELERWVSLFDDEAIYWVPCNDSASDPRRHVSIIHDDRRRLDERLLRMRSPMFWAQDPPSRTSRLVGNVQLQAHSEGLEVSSRFILVELRRGCSTTFAGRYRHLLHDGGAAGFRILRKEAHLISNDEPYYNLTFLF